MSDLLQTTSIDARSCLISRDLDIGYAAEVIVEKINFTLSCGQSLALVGVNGSGKTTLLKTLVGLLPPVRGQVSLLGYPPVKAYRKLAYLSQFHPTEFVLPLQAGDVVRMGRFPDKGLFGRMTHEDEQIVDKSMRRMGVDHLKHTPLNMLSGGQQQRVYLSMMLARQADLLVLDEPASSLDATGKDLFSRALKEELERGAMVVIATHDIQQAMGCDLAMLLARQVVAMGPSRDILTPEALLEAFGIGHLFQSQDRH